MIILNACSTRKIVFNNSEEFQFFSVVPNPPKDFEMHHFNDIIVDAQTAAFLREYPIEWLRSEDKRQVLAVNIQADKDICRHFLTSVIGVDSKKLLEDE